MLQKNQLKKVVKKTVAKVSKAKKKSTAEKAKVKAKKVTVVKKKVFAKPAPKVVPKRKLRVSAIVTSVGLTGIPPYKEKRGEEYMNEQQQQHFIDILDTWKNMLMEEVDRTVTHMKADAANFPDPNDRASQEEEFSLELRTRDRERKLIKKIEETLEKITNDDYGYCDLCGIEIGVKRLEARPTAELCIDCKTLDEIKEKQIVG